MVSGTERTPPGADAFDRLLAALDADRERAGERYEMLRRKLARFFEWRGAADPEDLVDRTFDRVGRKLLEGETIRAADPSHYVYAVAKNILKESWSGERRRREAGRGFVPAHGSAEETLSVETTHVCLDACLARMPERSRGLLLRYYGAHGSARIADRKATAEELGVPLNALRIRMHRARAALEDCIRGCLEKKTGETDREKSHLEAG
jgi:DNA-directed RNA polymerase specialized sigma24 family protein